MLRWRQCSLLFGARSPQRLAVILSSRSFSRACLRSLVQLVDAKCALPQRHLRLPRTSTNKIDRIGSCDTIIRSNDLIDNILYTTTILSYTVRGRLSVSGCGEFESSRLLADSNDVSVFVSNNPSTVECIIPRTDPFFYLVGSSPSSLSTATLVSTGRQCLKKNETPPPGERKIVVSCRFLDVI